MMGIEDRVWVKADDFERVWAVADEDLERETEDRTSSVHFLRFELTPEMIRAVKHGADISVGIEHEAYAYQVDPIDAEVRNSLVHDLSE